MLQDQVEHDFSLSLETLNEVKECLKAEFVKGLAKDGQCVEMLPTFVHKLPDETVHGDFMAIDLGGTNFRVGKYSELATESQIVLLFQNLCISCIFM